MAYMFLLFSVSSFNDVLNGRKKAVLIRIAHVGATGRDPIRGVCENDYICKSIPTTSENEPTLLRYLSCKEGKPTLESTRIKNVDFSKPTDFHADPLIYALRIKEGKSKLILSLTYGENDVEPKRIWYNFVKEKRWGWSTDNVEAYVLFNSTFTVHNLNIQLIHGGFKAVMSNPLGCFGASTPPKYCLEFQVDENTKDGILERVQVNPHWIRGDFENENISALDFILMMVGNESSWFFSLPIAPPPLYFIAQGCPKTEKS